MKDIFPNVQKWVCIAGTTLGLLSLSSCASQYITISPEPPAKYEKLGRAEGTATGSLGVMGTAYYVIPMGLNSRVENAYANALKSVPGATGIVNVTLQESWFWWVVGTARMTTISGDAIKEVKE